jgi:hypothetical protein
VAAYSFGIGGRQAGMTIELVSLQMNLECRNWIAAVDGKKYQENQMTLTPMALYSTSWIGNWEACRSEKRTTGKPWTVANTATGLQGSQ